MVRSSWRQLEPGWAVEEKVHAGSGDRGPYPRLMGLLKFRLVVRITVGAIGVRHGAVVKIALFGKRTPHMLADGELQVM
jgi:hypothetical protein